ncbi:MAG: hypothetical protein ABI614_06655, partial [Planctomycetota bacterium]
MSEFLFQYEPVPPTTWVYLSSLLMIGVYFKFSRFWSVRNVDLALLILLAPGLLMVILGEQKTRQEAGRSEPVAVVDDDAAADVEDEADATNSTELILTSDRDASGPVEETAAPPPEADPSSESAETEGDLAATDGDSTQRAEEWSGQFVGYIWLFSVLGI